MLDYQGVFCRVEKKYLLTPSQHDSMLKGLLAHGFEVDRYGEHTISNIYYDTEDFALIRRSIEKPVYKEKLRLRAYGSVDRDGTSFVEIKKKYKGIVYKRRVTMPLDAAVNALERGTLPPECGQIGREVSWFMHYYTPKPRVMIAYERVALFSKTDDCVRVTLDQNLRFRTQDLDLANGAYGTLILPRQMHLMEVKVLGALPLWLVHLMEQSGVQQTSFSKYGHCYQHFLLKHEKGIQISA